MESDFEFSRGVNAIIGIMGSGKTSILQAISFGLYGTFPAHQARRVGLEELIMKKPQEMNEAEVEIGFEVAGKKYSVLRILKRGKGTVKAEIREDGKLLEATPQGVTREVGRILDMDYELFARAVYSEQNALDYFLRIPRGQRMDHIDRMLRLDRFEKAREGAVSLSNRLRQEREDRLKVVADLRKEQLPERIDLLRKELQELQEDTIGLEEKARVAKKKVRQAEDRLTGLEKQEKELNEAKQALEGVEAGLRQVVESLASKSNAGETIDKKDLEFRLRNLDQAVKELEKGLQAARQAREGAREQVASLNAEIRIVVEGLEEIEKLGDRCPTCEQEIGKPKKRELVDTRKFKEEKLRDQVMKVAEEAEESGRTILELEEKLRQRINKREGLRTHLQDIGFLEGLAKRRDEYSQRREKLARRVADLEAGLSGKDLSGLRDSLRQVSNEESSLRARHEGAVQRIRDREEMLRELRTREDMLVKYSQESRMDQEILEKLKRFTEAVRLTQDQLREEFLKTVNHTMARIWGQLYPYGDFTGIRLAIDKDYVLQLREPSGWVSVEGMASGGERSMASLALRVAFSMAFIPNLRWLILDEPTHNLDLNAIDFLTETLRERISSFAEQVFLITHDERVSEGVEGKLYRLERDKDRNEPTRIAGLEE